MSRNTPPKNPPLTDARKKVPRTISFQPLPCVRDMLERVRRERGLKDRTTLINEAIVARFRAKFGKKDQEEIAPILARVDAEKGKAAE